MKSKLTVSLFIDEHYWKSQRDIRIEDCCGINATWVSGETRVIHTSHACFYKNSFTFLLIIKLNPFFLFCDVPHVYISLLNRFHWLICKCVACVLNEMNFYHEWRFVSWCPQVTLILDNWWIIGKQVAFLFRCHALIIDLLWVLNNSYSFNMRHLAQQHLLWVRGTTYNTP